MSINMCQHPTYQVNVWVLRAPDSSKFFGTPCSHKILFKCDGSSLTAARIVVSLTLKVTP